MPFPIQRIHNRFADEKAHDQIIKQYQEAYDKGLHPIHLAAQLGHQDLVADFLRDGIDAYEETNTPKKQNVWEVALENKQYSICGLLEQHGFKIEDALIGSVTKDPVYFRQLLEKSRSDHDLFQRALYCIGGWFVCGRDEDEQVEDIDFPDTYDSGFASEYWDGCSHIMLSTEQLNLVESMISADEFDSLLYDMILTVSQVEDARLITQFFNDVRALFPGDSFAPFVEKQLQDLEADLFDEELDEDVRAMAAISLVRFLQFTQTQQDVAARIQQLARDFEEDFLNWIATAGDIELFKTCLAGFTFSHELADELILSSNASAALIQVVLSKIGGPVQIREYIRRHNFDLLRSTLLDEDVFFVLLEQFDVKEQISILKDMIAFILVSNISAEGLEKCFKILKRTEDLSPFIVKYMEDEINNIMPERLVLLVQYFSNQERWAIWAIQFGKVWIDYSLSQLDFESVRAMISNILVLMSEPGDRITFLSTWIQELSIENENNEEVTDFFDRLRYDSLEMVRLAELQNDYLSSQNKFDLKLLKNIPRRVADLESFMTAMHKSVFVHKNERKATDLFSKLPSMLTNEVLSFVTSQQEIKHPDHLEIAVVMQQTVKDVKDELKAISVASAARGVPLRRHDSELMSAIKFWKRMPVKQKVQVAQGEAKADDVVLEPASKMARKAGQV